MPRSTSYRLWAFFNCGILDALYCFLDSSPICLHRSTDCASLILSTLSVHLLSLSEFLWYSRIAYIWLYGYSDSFWVGSTTSLGWFSFWLTQRRLFRQWWAHNPSWEPGAHDQHSHLVQSTYDSFQFWWFILSFFCWSLYASIYLTSCSNSQSVFKSRIYFTFSPTSMSFAYSCQ